MHNFFIINFQQKKYLLEFISGISIEKWFTYAIFTNTRSSLKIREAPKNTMRMILRTLFPVPPLSTTRNYNTQQSVTVVLHPSWLLGEHWCTDVAACRQVGKVPALSPPCKRNSLFCIHFCCSNVAATVLLIHFCIPSKKSFRLFL